jgi:Mor family transcriptional regulator
MTHYSTSYIAEMLGIKRTNVNYYIRAGHLKASLVDGNYKILKKDFEAFRDEYFLSNDRLSSRGPTKKLTHQNIVTIGLMVQDVQDNSISLEKFSQRYSSSKKLYFFKDFLKYKRDALIRFDREHKNLTYKELSNKYNLSQATIEQIIKKSENEY